MEIKMCTCPNGHYYNADIYSSCPECGAASGMAAGAAPIPATAPAYNAPVFGGITSVAKGNITFEQMFLGKRQKTELDTGCKTARICHIAALACVATVEFGQAIYKIVVVALYAVVH